MKFQIGVIGLGLWVAFAGATAIGNPGIREIKKEAQFQTERIVTSTHPDGLNSPTDIPTVGDQILIKVKDVGQVPEAHVVLDSQKKGGQSEQKDEYEGWAILGVKAPETTSESPSDLVISLVSLKPGKRVLPSLLIEDASGQRLGRTTPIEIETQSAISPKDPKPDQPEDVEPPAGLQFPFWILAIVGFFALLFALSLGYGIYKLIKKYKVKSAKPIRVLTEDELALESLANLSTSGLVEKGNFKQYYFKISEILKIYVGARYSFDAPESTTREMIQTLKGRKLDFSISETVLESLLFLFEKLDLVKFTDHVPETKEVSEVFGESKEFILATRRDPVDLDSKGVRKNAVQ